MKNHFKNLIDNKEQRTISLSLITLGIILIIIAFIVGISDNLPGISLLMFGVGSILFAFIHTWKKPKKFLILLLVSVIGFIGSVLFHNMFDAFAEMNKETMIIHNILNFFSVVFFFLGVIIFPVTAIVGIGGTIIMYIKK
ncbi:MAG: hypothetical protein ABFR32_09615 [Bacteroidota bacterium]